MGERLGLIAGAGEYPLLALDEAKARGYVCIVAGVRGEALPDLESKAEAFEWIGLTELDKLVRFLQGQDVRKVLLAGKIDPRAAVRGETFDGPLLHLASQARDRTPSSLIRSLIASLEARGFAVIDPTFLLERYFCEAGSLAATPPAPAILEDIEFGWERARLLADQEIGQTLVVKSKAVVAVEGLEGTDETIKRAGRLAGDGIVVLKLCRTSQDMRIDVPAVGAETMRSLVRVRAAALCLEAGRMPFFQREEALALADANGIAVLARK